MFSYCCFLIQSWTRIQKRDLKPKFLLLLLKNSIKTLGQWFREQKFRDVGRVSKENTLDSLISKLPEYLSALCQKYSISFFELIIKDRGCVKFANFSKFANFWSGQVWVGCRVRSLDLGSPAGYGSQVYPNRIDPWTVDMYVSVSYCHLKS